MIQACCGNRFQLDLERVLTAMQAFSSSTYWVQSRACNDCMTGMTALHLKSHCVSLKLYS